MEHASDPTESNPRSVVRPTALIVGAGKEPDPYLTELDAQGSWVAASALWHPALLARSTEVPRLIDVFEPGSPEPGQTIVLAHGSQDRLASGWRTQAADCGALLVEAGPTRAETTVMLLEQLGFPGDPTLAGPGDPDELRTLVDDFHALGTAHWWLAELTAAMNHVDCLDHDEFARETLAAAADWNAGDPAGSRNRLRAAFEVLTRARERFYPVDAYFVDICLLDARTKPSSLEATLRDRLAVSFLATGEAIANLARRDPEKIQAIRDGVRDGWIDVVGGTWSEAEESLLPLESVLHQYRRGARAYREHLDDRNVETWARRRFGMHVQAPQIAKRIGLRFGLPMSFDGAKFPLRAEVKRLWEAPDGSTLECLFRPPIAADLAAEGVRLPWRIGLTMRDDHSATLPIIRWASRSADWFADLRRISSYAAVLSRWVTVNDYFHLTDRPFEGVRPQPDDYLSPYLDQSVASDEPRPISKHVLHARARAELDAAEALRAVAACLTETSVDADSGSTSPEEREDRLESGRFEEVHAEIAAALPAWGAALARGVIGDPAEIPRPGFLVFNPIGQARRAAVILPEAAPDLKAEGPLRAAQLTDEGVWAVVELPAYGYAWIPREPEPGGGGIEPGEVSLRDNRLRNAAIELQVDAQTGGIRGFNAAGEATARLGQQLAVRGLVDAQGSPITTKMVADRIEPEYAGPVLAQSVATGRIVDSAGARIADFEQRYRVWNGRPIADVDIDISNISESHLSQFQHADPRRHAFVAAWAWPDKESTIRSLQFGHPWETFAERLETNEAIDISTRSRRVALLFGGLAHHRRHSSRMLDTSLIVGREVERHFRFGLALDLEYPFQAAQERLAPAFVIPTESGPPPSGPVGRFFTLDQKSVQAHSLRFVDDSGDGRGWGVRLLLVETAGRSSRCRVQCFRNPVWGRQLDLSGDVLVDLSVEDDSVMVEMTPHEIAVVEITLG
ncbi:MAG: glycosyl hydrolase family 38 [Isosphaeraceae bacterium]|nr:glycosyl hydrolase family 38 [Isosphaeraceae bacterium]